MHEKDLLRFAGDVTCLDDLVQVKTNRNISMIGIITEFQDNRVVFVPIYFIETGLTMSIDINNISSVVRIRDGDSEEGSGSVLA